MPSVISIDRDRLAEIGFGDWVTTSRLVSIFIADAQARVGAIQQALENQDWKTVAYESHSLKGASLNVGAGSLAKSCSDLEIRARDHREPIDQHCIEAIRNELDAVGEMLRKAIEESCG